MRYFYNSWDPAYKSHFGAIARNQSCQFTIRLPEETPLDFSPVLVVFRTGFKERFLPMNVKEHENGYVTYTTDLIPKYSGVHYYYFSYTSNGVRHYIKRGDACHGTLDQGEMFQLTVYNEDYQTPQFLKGGVMYQIFPDRFCSSGKMHDNVPSDRVMREWGELPYYKPDQNGHVWNNDYFGGDLHGIRSKLDYLKDLGVTCIYLNPIFESHENHRYNTANYRNVDPLLGTNEDFRELCKAAKVRGISVILDGVFSHTGADSIYFNKFGRYNTPGAYQSENSPYYSWYHFWGNKEYESWWGIDTLPNVDENNPSYTKYICGDDGVLDYWMSLGAAGYRLDVADELPDEFLDNLRTCVKKYDEEKIVIGEVWEDASNKEAYGVKRRYLLGDQLDSVMNYPFREAIIAYMKGEAATTFRDRIMVILENYPKMHGGCVDELCLHPRHRACHQPFRRSALRRQEQGLDGIQRTVSGRVQPWQGSAQRALWYSSSSCPASPAFIMVTRLACRAGKTRSTAAAIRGAMRIRNWWNTPVRWRRSAGSIRLFAEGAMEFLVLEEKVLGFARYILQNGSSAVVLMNRSDETAMVSLRDKCFEKYAFSTVISGICDGDAVILPAHSYAVVSAVRSNQAKTQ